MREIRMEVISEEEGREYCNEHGYTFEKCYMGRGSNSGCLMMLAYAPGSSISEAELERMYVNSQLIDQTKDTVVRAFYANNLGRPIYIYVPNKSSNGITFDINEAKRFAFDKAKIKAKKMRSYNRYAWEAHRLKSR